MMPMAPSLEPAGAGFAIRANRHVAGPDFADRSPAQQAGRTRAVEPVSGIAAEGDEISIRRCRLDIGEFAENDSARRLVTDKAEAERTVDIKRPGLGCAVKTE